MARATLGATQSQQSSATTRDDRGTPNYPKQNQGGISRQHAKAPHADKSDRRDAAANLKDADPGDDSDSESVYGSANSSQQTLSTSSINFDSRSYTSTSHVPNNSTRKRSKVDRQHAYRRVSTRRKRQESTHGTQCSCHESLDHGPSGHNSISSHNTSEQLVSSDGVRPRQAIRLIAEHTFRELLACSELFGSWSEEIGALPQDSTTRPLLDAVNQVRLLSDEASRNSRRIIEEHSKLAGMMAARLEEAKRTGVLGRNDDITSTGEGICQSSAALCTKMRCLRDRLQNLSQVIEDIQRRNSKQQVSWWGRICRWIPNVLRAVKSIFTTIKKALRNLRGGPLPPSDVAEIVKRYDAYDTGNIEETQQLSNLRHFLEELSAKILQVEDNLQEIQTGQSSLQLYVEAETSQLIIDVKSASLASSQWRRLERDLKTIAGRD